MLASKVFILTTFAFAFFSIYALFYSLYQTQLKFHDTSSLNLLTQDNSTAWFKPKVKVVMVIIDALRFDYLLNYKNIDNDPALNNHKLQLFNHAYFKNPEQFVVIRAKADIPTLTVLRVPCLMTGNIPRLGSVLTAFGALPAEEDSIPRQLHLQSKKSYFTGDPILKENFPQYFGSDYNKVAAFNVKDWRVDEPSHIYINNKLAENKFDFLAAHLLRLDHMGHVTGLGSHEVLHAIQDIDRFLVQIMNTIDENTMLLIAGDHGMTKSGRDGGSSKQERHTAIMAYYKKGFKKYKQKNHDLKRIMRSISETIEQVNQIDLVPTLSMLMGLPIPFSNMGQILNDLYPKGDYFSFHSRCPETTPFDASFEMQMLHDNYLNTLQVWNYFKKYHEGQNLFNQEEFSNVTKLFEETDALYKAAKELIHQSRQCQDSFHKAVIKAIEKSQKLSNEIHHLVTTRTPHDLVIFWQALIILVLVGFSYILLIQYLYKTKDLEHITWTPPKSWKSVTKILIVILSLIWICMLWNSPRVMRPLTSTVLVLAISIVYYSIVFLFSKPHHSFETVNTSEINEEEEKPQTPSFYVESFFILQHPFISAGAAIIIGVLFYLTHILLLDKSYVAELGASTPAVFALLVGARLTCKSPKISSFLITAPFVFAIVLDFAHIPVLCSEKSVIFMGLLLIADWLWGEIQFALRKLRAGQIWSYQYIICFIILVLYHLVKDPKTELVQITLPRLVWVILILSCLAGFVLKMPRKVIKRNIQINFVLFLTLMQLHRKLLFFGIVLSLMRVLTYLFKKAQYKNYLYPLLMALLSYTGLFSLGFQDRKLPRNFEPAFVGMHDFQLGVCLFLYSSAFFSTITLGMLFMSFHSQDLELQEMELGNKTQGPSNSQVVSFKGHPGIIKKRNIILYCFFYCLIMIGAAIDPVVLQSHKIASLLSRERFLVDAVFYLFTISVVPFLG